MKLVKVEVVNVCETKRGLMVEQGIKGLPGRLRPEIEGKFSADPEWGEHVLNMNFM